VLQVEKRSNCCTWYVDYIPTFSCGRDTYYAFINFLEDNAFYLSAVCTLFYVLCAVECPWRIIVLKYSYGIEIYGSCSSGI
jgi:hypothetical protein